MRNLEFGEQDVPLVTFIGSFFGGLTALFIYFFAFGARFLALGLRLLLGLTLFLPFEPNFGFAPFGSEL